MAQWPYIERIPAQIIQNHLNIMMVVKRRSDPAANLTHIWSAFVNNSPPNVIVQQ